MEGAWHPRGTCVTFNIKSPLLQNNVDREFEGVEECLICFSIVLATRTDGRLPDVKCGTCRKVRLQCLINVTHPNNSGFTRRACTSGLKALASRIARIARAQFDYTQQLML